MFFGPLFGLLTPPSVYHAFDITTETKQLLTMFADGIFGAVCCVGMTYLVKRRLSDARATSNASDIFIRMLIYFQLILGLASIGVSAFRLDGAQMLLLAE